MPDPIGSQMHNLHLLVEGSLPTSLGPAFGVAITVSISPVVTACSVPDHAVVNGRMDVYGLSNGFCALHPLFPLKKRCAGGVAIAKRFKNSSGIVNSSAAGYEDSCTPRHDVLIARNER